MKKLLFALVAFGAISFSGYASNDNLFELNEDKINSEMSALNELETYVEMNENATLSTVSQLNPELTSSLKYSPESTMAHNDFSFDDMQWGSFAWGFCCWPIGIFTVLLNDSKGSDHKISYFIGIGVSLILAGPTYFLY
ncbi:hypothetical protein GCM10027429_07880 [Marivirga atlantica]|jgi:hypothetical protein|uniref:Uncharacterized protein n=1 Tax=Marivirga atlantica TaxID=1548457 RepID=A0A937AIV0_9BACT|nr:hypothetical protein [Marivirga atlantica]MBL0764398.1 hypothetical protein [Marivirga atlantica]